MAPLIQWQEPQSVRDFQRARDHAHIKRIQHIGLITLVIVGIPALGLCFWFRDAMPGVCVALLLGLVFPTALTWPERQSAKRQRCEIRDNSLDKFKGTSTSIWSLTTHVKWDEVQNYEFVNHPVLAEVRCLVLRLKKSKAPRVFHFSHQDGVEERLQSLLAERVKSSGS